MEWFFIAPQYNKEILASHITSAQTPNSSSSFENMEPFSRANRINDAEYHSKSAQFANVLAPLPYWFSGGENRISVYIM